MRFFLNTSFMFSSIALHLKKEGSPFTCGFIKYIKIGTHELLVTERCTWMKCEHAFCRNRKQEAHLRCHTCGASCFPAGEAPLFAYAPKTPPADHRGDRQPAFIQCDQKEDSLKRMDAHPHLCDKSLFAAHELYDSSTPGLSFSVCQGRGSLCKARGEAAGRRRHKKGKGHRQVVSPTWRHFCLQTAPVHFPGKQCEHSCWLKGMHGLLQTGGL